jgi:2-polyprenyl-3-methyl-5-hydroxy-6-metoxy-1,4-benzoquinol methylase
MQKVELEEVYTHHHCSRGRYGYLYCGGDRVPYLKRWIGQGKRVLDLGCRDGMLTQFYAEGNEVLGVDIDRNALRLAEERLNIETMWLDLNQEWPFEAGSFDAIVACEILEHLFILQPFLANISRSLKPNGLFIGSVPNAFRVRNRLKFLAGREFETDPTHVRMFSHEKLVSSLSDFFSDIEIIPIQGKVLPFLSVSERLPKWCGRLFGKDLLWRSVK